MPASDASARAQSQSRLYLQVALESCRPCDGGSLENSPVSDPPDRQEPDRHRAAIAQRADRQPGEPEDVALLEPVPGPARTLHVDLAGQDEHDRVFPSARIERHRLARRHRYDLSTEGRPDRPGNAVDIERIAVVRPGLDHSGAAAAKRSTRSGCRKTSIS